jgi:hypothetical protein
MAHAYEKEEEEVRAGMDAYLEAFQSLSVERTMPFYYTPGFLIGPSITMPLGSTDQVRGFLEQTFAQLRAQDYVGSRWADMNIFVLLPKAALVSAVWERVDKEGKTLGRSGTTYQLIKADGEWRIISGVMHEESTILRLPRQQ